MNNSPSPTGANGKGRDAHGRFASGNKSAKGNPLAKKVGQLRSAAISAVSVADMRAIFKSLVKQAKQGDVAAAKEVLTRCLGKPTEIDLLERLEQLEAMLDRSNS